MSLLENKVVMITGVGRGLGRELARAFIAEGCTVVGVTKNDAKLKETDDYVANAQFHGQVGDVADFEQIQSIVGDAESRFGRIDILFNNAAVYPRINFTAESAAEWSQAIAVNVNGVAYVCKAVLPGMISRGYGRIFNLGSFADLAPIPESAAYSASKGAIHALTKAIAADLQELDLDIEVHEWIPGHLKTRMSEFTGIEPAVSAGWAVQLAQQPNARTRNCIFVNDEEWLPSVGLRQRIKDRLRSLVPGSS